MDRTQAAEEDCEGIVNYAIGIGGIEVAVFLSELRDHRVRLSLRSKGRVNVATIAERFGGGGHENASGCTLDGPLPAATERILAYLRSEMAAVDSTQGGRLSLHSGPFVRHSVAFRVASSDACSILSQDL